MTEPGALSRLPIGEPRKHRPTYGTGFGGRNAPDT